MTPPNIYISLYLIQEIVRSGDAFTNKNNWGYAFLDKEVGSVLD